MFREEFLVPSRRLCWQVGAGVVARLRNHLPRNIGFCGHQVECKSVVGMQYNIVRALMPSHCAWKNCMCLTQGTVNQLRREGRDNDLPSGRDKSRVGRVSNAVYIKCCLKARIGMLNEPMRIPSSWLVTPTAPCVHAEPRLSLNLICWLRAAQQLPSHSTSVPAASRSTCAGPGKLSTSKPREKRTLTDLDVESQFFAEERPACFIGSQALTHRLRLGGIPE